MSFLPGFHIAKEYVDNLCQDICQAFTSGGEKVTEWYNANSPFGSPGLTSRENQGATEENGNEVTFVPIKPRVSARPRDEVTRVNELLCWECEKAREEHRLLKLAVDNLAREYETSKEVDVFRRYTLLKNMIKRSVTHVRLRSDDAVGQALSTGKQRQEMKKREENITGLSTQEIVEENSRLQAMIKEYRRKASLISDLIVELDNSYQSSKRYLLVQRYRLLKNMIKTVIHNQWLNC